jgi:hypothetical protein
LISSGIGGKGFLVFIAANEQYGFLAVKGNMFKLLWANGSFNVFEFADLDVDFGILDSIGFDSLVPNLVVLDLPKVVINKVRLRLKKRALKYNLQMDIEDTTTIEPLSPAAPEAPPGAVPSRKGRRSMQTHEVNHPSKFQIDTDIDDTIETEQTTGATEDISKTNSNTKQGWGNEDNNTEKVKRNRRSETDIDDSKKYITLK